MTKQKLTFFKPRHISSHFIRINIVSDLRSQNLFEHTNDVAENYSKALHDKAKGRLDMESVESRCCLLLGSREGFVSLWFGLFFLAIKLFLDSYFSFKAEWSEPWNPNAHSPRQHSSQRTLNKKILNKLPKSDDELTQLRASFGICFLCETDTMCTHDVSIIN